MAGISSKAAGKLENKFKYNGKEEQRQEFSDGSGLEFYDFNARTYDQQIGRFHQIDPLAEQEGQERLTSYHYCYNNPVLYTDPDGRIGLLGAIIGGAGGFIYGAVKHGFKNGGWKKVLATTAGGAVAGATMGLGLGAIAGVGGAAALSTAGATMATGGTAILSAAAGNLTEQGVSMALGAQDMFDAKDLAFSMTLAVPEAILSKAVFDPLGNSIKSELSGAIMEGAINTLSAKERGQMVKDIAKQLKGEIGSAITKKDAKIAAEKVVNLMQDSESATMKFSIKVTEKGVSVGTVVAESAISDKNKETVNQ